MYMYAHASRFDITYIRSAAAHERATHACGGPIVLTTGAVFGLSAYQRLRAPVDSIQRYCRSHRSTDPVQSAKNNTPNTSIWFCGPIFRVGSMDSNSQTIVCVSVIYLRMIDPRLVVRVLTKPYSVSNFGAKLPQETSFASAM